MTQRFFLALSLAVTLCFCGSPFSSVKAAELNIGDAAPSLDIEHWIQDGKGYFKPVEEFEKDKVYVVEFWATWCGPCIMSMPHLAELQDQYRGEGVQVISITNETLEEVKELLSQDHPKAGKSFDEVTASYSLTADPDESVYDDYMRASGAQGIPTAFIVGKDGKIEWTGHPMSMNEPLAKVVDGSWDRETYKEELEQEQQLQENMQKMAQIAGSGNFKEALEFVVVQVKEAPNEALKDHWENIRHNVKLAGNMLDKETIAYFRGHLSQMTEDGDLQSMLQLGNMLYGVADQDGDLGPLGEDVVSAIQVQGKKEVPDQLKPLYHNTIALLSEAAGDFKKAAKEQTKAMEACNPRQRKRMMPYLKELQEKAGIEAPGE